MATTLFNGTRIVGRGFTIENFEMEVHRCGSCGVVFAIEIEYLNERRNDHTGWSCPNGHSFVYNGPSEEEKLRAELKREKERRARVAAERDQAQASLSATRGVVTRMKNRSKAGICPVDGCHRHFENLERHIASRHPGFEATIGVFAHE